MMFKLFYGSSVVVQTLCDTLAWYNLAVCKNRAISDYFFFALAIFLVEILYSSSSSFCHIIHFINNRLNVLSWTEYYFVNGEINGD